MALVPSHKNALVLLKEFRSELEDKTDITNFEKVSKARVLSDIFVEQEIQNREDQIAVFYANQLANAQGDALDSFSRSVAGPERRQIKFAEVSSSEPSLAFYVLSGNFGAINGGGAISVPKGTTVFSNPNENELGTSITYTLSSEVTLGAAESLSYVSAIAQVAGTNSNVGRQVLRNHGFTAYVDIANSSLKIVNFYPILNGQDKELDSAFRARIAQHLGNAALTNTAKIALDGLQIPGVVQTRVIPGHYGIGTAAAVVLGPEYQSNTRLVAGVQAKLNAIKAPGQRLSSIAATTVQFDFEIELKAQNTFTPAQKNRIQAEIRKGCLAYFRTLGLGTTFNSNTLLTRIQKALSTVISLSTISGQSPFKAIYIRRGYSNGTLDERQKLLTAVIALESHEYAAIGELEISYVE